jgi:ribonuclease HII
MLIAGVDEAGRGPVIGPLVLGVAVIQKEQEDILKKIGVKDSKLLTLKERIRQEKEIKQIAEEYGVEQITAKEIDELRERKSLNEIEAMRIGVLLNRLHKKPDVVYVDSPDPTAAFFGTRIKKYLDFSCTIVSEHKADLNYPVVSAASILAKTIRDHEIEKLTEQYGEIGCGYPHDPLTITFLNRCVEKDITLPDCVRKSWQTTKDIVNKKYQQKLGDW